MGNGETSGDLVFGLSKHHSPLGCQAGWLISVFLIIAALKYIKNKSIVSLLIYGSLVLVNLGTLILSGSRTAAVAIFISLAAVISLLLFRGLIKTGKTTRYALLMALLLMPLLIYVFGIETSKGITAARFHNDGATSTGTGMERFTMFQIGFDNWLRSPIFGSGAKSFKNYEQNVHLGRSITQSSLNPHNDYLDVLGNYGLIGLLMAFVFVFFILKTPLGILFTNKKSPPPKPELICVALGTTGVLVYCLTYALADYSLRTPWTLLPILFLIGASHRYMRDALPSREKKLLPLPLKRTIFITFSLTLFLFAIVNYFSVAKNFSLSLIHNGHNDLYSRNRDWVLIKNKVLPNSNSLITASKFVDKDQKLLLISEAYTRNPYSFFVQKSYGHILSQHNQTEAAEKVWSKYLKLGHLKRKHFQAQAWYTYHLYLASNHAYITRETEESYWLAKQCLFLFSKSHHTRFGFTKIMPAKAQRQNMIDNLRQRIKVMEAVGVEAVKPAWVSLSGQEFEDLFFIK